jgi:5-methylcytosine-specific restriction endonuclease McrA
MCRTHADIFRKHGTTERPPKRVPYTEEERKERARAAQRAYQSTPKGARYNRDKSREWYRSLSGEKLEAYRVKCHEWFKGWISKNRARNRERAKEYYRANKETILAKIGIYRRRYEERKRGRNLTLTDQEKADLVAFYKVSRSQKAIRCYWCGKRTKKTDRHLDHIVPISKGGPHLASNLCVACRDCNMTKHAQMPEQFSAQAVLL